MAQQRLAKKRVALVAVRAIATVGYLGHIPKVPGTAASCLGAVLASVVPTNSLVFIVSVLLALCAAVPVATAAERAFGTHDDPRIVIDELLGMLVAVAYLPQTPVFLISGFVLFRVFDIAKPLGIRRLQVLPGGVGIVADDVCAGLATNVILRVVAGVLP